MEHELNPTPANPIVKRRCTPVALRNSHVEAWKQSGLSMSQFCRQHGLALSSFSVWAQKYNNAKNLTQPTFKPLTLSNTLNPTLMQDNVIEIHFTQHVKIRLLNVRDSAFVVAIAKELAACN